MKTENIHYKNYLRRENHINNLKKHGVVLIFKKNKLKLFLGISCLTIAIIPNGLGVFMFPLSFCLLGITLKDYEKFRDNLKFKIWLRFNK